MVLRQSRLLLVNYNVRDLSYACYYPLYTHRIVVLE